LTYRPSHSAPLEYRSESTARAEALKYELRDRIASFHGDIVNEKQAKLEITADMTRQYKSMQEDLLTRVAMLEGQVEQLKLDLGTGVCLIQTMCGHSTR
jgi:hypothetical protein